MTISWLQCIEKDINPMYNFSCQINNNRLIDYDVTSFKKGDELKFVFNVHVTKNLNKMLFIKLV